MQSLLAAGVGDSVFYIVVVIGLIFGLVVAIVMAEIGCDLRVTLLILRRVLPRCPWGTRRVSFVGLPRCVFEARKTDRKVDPTLKLTASTAS